MHECPIRLSCDFISYLFIVFYCVFLIYNWNKDEINGICHLVMMTLGKTVRKID